MKKLSKKYNSHKSDFYDSMQFEEYLHNKKSIKDALMSFTKEYVHAVDGCVNMTTVELLIERFNEQ